jgi:hypothetical protein
MQNVVCCEHTWVRCVAITWAHCTRVAAVRAPEGARRKIAIDPADYGRCRGIR